jgi:nitrogenase molybdenum-iron protein alpha/beta subunit
MKMILHTFNIFVETFHGTSLPPKIIRQFSNANLLNQHHKYSGPYHGYDGFAIFARDMDLALNSPTWGLIGAPWNKSAKKALRAKAAV